MTAAGSKKQPFFDDCVFCNSRLETFGNTPEFKRIIGDETPRRKLYETKNFVVLPSVGQIVEGYLLIMPKKHSMSIANLDPELFSELQQVYNETKKILKENYAEPIFFEHGVCRSEYYFNGCCVDHAHIHAVPAHLNISDELKKEFDFKKIKDVTELQNAKNTNYLYVHDATGDHFVFDANSIKSQHVRYLIAELLETPQKGDWSLYPGKKEMLATIKKLAGWKQNKLQVRTNVNRTNARERS